MSSPEVARRRPRSLALELVSSLSERIRDGHLQIGDKMPTEAAIMAEFDVSRTVVREALSKLQASGLVETRHGIGTFVLGLGGDTGFKITREQFGTLQDVVAVLELRIGIETEAAALAAQRRTEKNLDAMRKALDALGYALEHGNDAVAADFLFHQEIARATQNDHFAELMTTLGSGIIPRARLEAAQAMTDERRQYLRRVNGEHESIFDAIAAQDPDGARAAMRTHLANSRERRRRAQAEIR
jgi:GntR family transcriptional repressor for pyruvate dehydrogenase complex